MSIVSNPCHRYFTGTNQELKERMFVFQIVNESDADKLAFLRYLCRNIAHAVYRPDPDTYLKRMRVEDLGLDASDLNVAANFGSSVYRSIHRKVGRQGTRLIEKIPLFSCPLYFLFKSFVLLFCTSSLHF